MAQLYLQYPNADGEVGPPLRGFEKTGVLAPGATARLVFRLGREDVSVWDVAAHGFALVPGTFTALVGASSRDLRANATFTLG